MKSTTSTLSFQIDPVTTENRTAALKLFSRVFHEVMPGVASYVSAATDWEESRLITLNDEVVGCYALSRTVIGNFPGAKESTEKYNRGWRKGKGVQGIALAVAPEYRGMGIGRALRAYPEQSGRFAYSWGYAMESLNNLQEWLSYRRLIATTGGLHITLRDHQPLGLASHHFHQSRAFDCGTTCIQMVQSYIYGQRFGDYEALIRQAGCNPETGTKGGGMEAGLYLLGIDAERNPHQEEQAAFNFLDRALLGGSPFIMRTLTHGAKHWTIVYGKTDEGSYLLADPWLGLHTLTTEEVNGRWSPRQFDGFSIR